MKLNSWFLGFLIIFHYFGFATKGVFMAVDKELLEILACPVCKTEVTYNEEKQQIICAKCGRKYPVKDDIPIMLVDEATMD
jgi:uncharacterized protein